VSGRDFVLLLVLTHSFAARAQSAPQSKAPAAPKAKPKPGARATAKPTPAADAGAPRSADAGRGPEKPPSRPAPPTTQPAPKPPAKAPASEDEAVIRDLDLLFFLEMTKDYPLVDDDPEPAKKP
jgi:hypothetical protein